MRNIENSKAVLSAPPAFIAALASLGIFKMKLVYGDPWRAVIEIDFKDKPKLPRDWVCNMTLYDR